MVYVGNLILEEGIKTGQLLLAAQVHHGRLGRGAGPKVRCLQMLCCRQWERIRDLSL